MLFFWDMKSFQPTCCVGCCSEDIATFQDVPYKHYRMFPQCLSYILLFYMNTNKWILVMLNQLYNKRQKFCVDPHMIDIYMYGLFGLYFIRVLSFILSTDTQLVLYYFQLTCPSPIYLKFYCLLFPCLSLSLVYTQFLLFHSTKGNISPSTFPLVHIICSFLAMILISLVVYLFYFHFSVCRMSRCLYFCLHMSNCLYFYCHMSNCMYFYCHMSIFLLSYV